MRLGQLALDRDPDQVGETLHEGKIGGVEFTLVGAIDLEDAIFLPRCLDDDVDRAGECPRPP